MPTTIEAEIVESTPIECAITSIDLTKPYRDVRSYSSFATAISSISTGEATLVISSEEAVEADVTSPTNVTLRFLHGGTLNISSTKTVTINGHVEAGLYQIFEGDGSVSFGSGLVKEVYPQWWGCDSSATADQNRDAIQAAINAQVASGSGEVWLAGGVIQVSLATSQAYCLSLPSDSTFLIDKGTTLQLAPDQSTDATPAQLVLFQDVDNIYIGGGGTLSFNTANQSGWTGGYVQETGGSLIRGTATALHKNIKIENLIIDDCFSTAVYVVGSSSANRFDGVRICHLYLDKVGEGVLALNCKNVLIKDIEVTDSTDVMVGDPVEVSQCDGFLITEIFVHDNCYGQAIDVYNSKNGLVSDFVVDNVGGDGLEVADGGSGFDSENVRVENGIIRSCTGSGLLFWGANVKNVAVNGVEIDGAVVAGVQFAQDTPILGPITLRDIDCHDGTNSGLYIRAVKNLSVIDSRFNSNGADGIYWKGSDEVSDAAEIDGLIFRGCQTRGNGAVGLSIADLSYGYIPEISIIDHYAADNGVTDISLATGFRSKISIKNLLPGNIFEWGLEYNHIYEHAFITPTATMNYAFGCLHHVLTIIFVDVRTVAHGAGGGAAGGFVLAGATNFVSKSGDRLVLLWNSADDKYYEISRMVS